MWQRRQGMPRLLGHFRLTHVGREFRTGHLVVRIPVWLCYGLVADHEDVLGRILCRVYACVTFVLARYMLAPNVLVRYIFAPNVLVRYMLAPNVLVRLAKRIHAISAQSQSAYSV